MNRNRHAARAVAEAVVASHVRAARAVDVDVDRRVIDALVIPYGESARVTDDGRTFYEETFEAGGATPGELVAAYSGHRPTARGIERGELIGRADNLVETPEGLRGELNIAATSEGDRVLALARTLGRVHVSAEYALPRSYNAGETVVRSAAGESVVIDGVAVVLPPLSPQFSGALAAARAAGDEDDDEDQDGDEGEGTDDGEGTGEGARAAIPELVRREVARYATAAARTATRARSPLEQYRSMNELTVAARSLPRDAAATLSRAFHDEYHRWAARAWENQITPDNPGVMPPTWLQTVFGIIDQGRPAITALGGSRSAGDSGLELNWPYFDGDLRALVGVQAAEKTDITSVKVSLKKGTADLETFAGGSDVSYQLQRRSSPSYMATYNRIMNLAYALVTEDKFETDMVAASVGVGVFDPTAADADGAALRAWLFMASSKVKLATGRPATAALVASDAYAAIGGRPWLWPSQYGTTNTAGTSDAASLRINVSGLQIVEAPAFPTKAMILTNDDAIGWHEDGPFLVTAEDVPKLGTDVAVWGLGGTGVYLPKGVVANKAAPAAAKA